jgi:hypothetical protein
MSKYRRAAKVDSAQGPIVEALRAIPGVTVEVGHDDILCGHGGKNYWFEIKSEDAVSRRTGEVRKSAIRPGQMKLEHGWRGHYRIVSGLDEILADMGIRG